MVTEIKLDRPSFRTEKSKLILIDGISGTGKTMLSSVLDTYPNSHNPIFDYTFEQIVQAHYLAKIENDVIRALLRLKFDQLCYDATISRGSNFRPTDLSGVFRSTKRFRMLKQLFLRDGVYASKRVEKEKKNIVLVTHQLLSATKRINEALYQNLVVIECMRHPYFLIDHWNSYISVLGSEWRDFTLMASVNSEPIPWFMVGRSDEYHNTVGLERAALVVIELTKLALKLSDEMRGSNSFIFIPFEHFVKNPNKYIDSISRAVGEVPAKKWLQSCFKKEKIPRSNISLGPQKKIYMRYNSMKHESISDKEIFSRVESGLKTKLHKKYFFELKALSDEYLNKFDIWF